MSVKRFFSYDPTEDGHSFETFATTEEAKASAEKILAELKENAGDGWDDNVAWLCWGEIKQSAEQCNVKDRCEIADCEDGDHYHGSEFDHQCDYRLEDVGPAVNTD